jgi:biopolymer transport protein ExbD
MARSHRRLNAFGSIDVTPLVDLTFLLLIVFMITAPTLEYAVDVSPPELDAQPTDAEEPKVVTIDRGGSVFLGDRMLSIAELEQELRGLAASMPDLQIFIRADETRPYGEVIGVMRRIQRLGISEVSLVTAPEEG